MTMKNITYFTSKTYSGGVQVNDILVEPGVKKVNFDNVDGCNIEGICITSDNSYPDVEELFFGESVKTVIIDNHLFPNVKHISSKSKAILDDKDIIISNSHQLLNTFCKTENDVIDLKNVIDIRPSALAGCKATKIINEDNVHKWCFEYISDYKYVTDSKTGCRMFGNIIISLPIDEIIEIPDDRYNVSFADGIDITAQTMKLHKYETMLYVMQNSNAPSKIILDNKSKDFIFECAKIPTEISKCNRLKYIEINKDNPIYTTIDGILYTKDIKTLLACPKGRAGNVDIPDGVKYIADEAFTGSKIESIIFPKSLKRIGELAFRKCSRLHNVIFKGDLEYIGDEAFSHCTSLKTISIPNGIQVVNKYCFCQCPLENISLPESLSCIRHSAFDTASGKIILPSSVTNIESNNFLDAKCIYLNTNVIPKGLLMAIIPSIGSSYTLIAEIHTPCGIIYIPRNCNHTLVYDWLCRLSILPAQDIIENAPHTKLLPFVQGENFIAEMSALKIYEKTKDEYTKSFLKSRADAYARILIRDNSELEFKRLMDVNVLSYEQLNGLLEIANKLKNITFAAYILNALDKVNKDNKFNI